MGAFSIVHWLIIFVIIGGPLLGIIRGVQNSSILNALLSLVIPFYGLVYFFVARRPPGRLGS